jgi:LPXTG-motif cell wall-anchored protein
VTANLNLTINATAGPVLATTGVDPTGPSLFGGALLLAGAVLMFKRRSRTARS